MLSWISTEAIWRFPGRGCAALIVGLGLLAGGCAAPRAPVVRAVELDRSPRHPPAEAREPVGVYHVVEPGQTLWRIARTYGVDLDRLVQVNGIADPTDVAVGRRLLVPGATRTMDVEAAPPSVSSAGSGAFDWPLTGELLSRFGVDRRTHRHKGIDIRGRRGAPVRAAANGKVVYSGATMKGYGKTIILEHDGQLRSLYAHNSTLLVEVGDRVDRGQPIARVGKTGNATADHCHFEIRNRGVPVDPLRFLPTASGRLR